RPVQEQPRRAPRRLRDGLLDVGGVAHDPALGDARRAVLVQEDVGRLHVRVHQRRPRRERVDVVQPLRRAEQDGLPRRPSARRRHAPLLPCRRDWRLPLGR
ncbi:Os07g0574150, partial [Oryza sativa Japonica Group]